MRDEKFIVKVEAAVRGAELAGIALRNHAGTRNEEEETVASSEVPRVYFSLIREMRCFLKVVAGFNKLGFVLI